MASHKTVLTLAIVLLLLAVVGIAPSAAQGPTSTPGPTATFYPVPTGAYQGIRPTPTRIAVEALNPTGDAAERFADWIVQAWSVINLGKSESSAGIIDWMIFVGLLYLTIRGLARLVRQRDSNYED